MSLVKVFVLCLVIIMLVSVFLYCVYCCLRDKSINFIGLFVMISVTILVSYFCICADNENSVNSVKKEIKKNYDIDLQLNSFNQGLFNSHGLIGPFIGSREGDERFYDIYLVLDNDNKICAYTRNEKGVYLPLSDMSVDYLKTH